MGFEFIPEIYGVKDAKNKSGRNRVNVLMLLCEKCSSPSGVTIAVIVVVVVVSKTKFKFIHFIRLFSHLSFVH